MWSLQRRTINISFLKRKKENVLGKDVYRHGSIFSEAYPTRGLWLFDPKSSAFALSNISSFKICYVKYQPQLKLLPKLKVNVYI